ncbi:MAG: sulfonate ABC transporter ATP-binding protein [Acidobacteria bacterium]|nr:MAG: sulfonate ABC transporter ATP-binding protein [Acidobacteriota bacterium]
MIALKEVRKEYLQPNGERLRVLENITFEIAEGMFSSLLGPSGCGKSTILNLIAKLDRHTSGDILVNGNKIGFVFQQPRLLNWRTVTDNVALPLERDNSDKRGRRELAVKYLDLVGLSGFENYYPLQLSGGMQQRVAIARALVIDPDILLMDEPFSGLDEFTARKLRQELIRIWRETGKTIVFVTHSISEAVFLSEQILIVSQKPATIFKRVTVDVPYPREYGDLRLFEIETSLTRDFLEMNSER